FSLFQNTSSFVEYSNSLSIEKNYHRGVNNSKLLPIFFDRHFYGYENHKTGYFEFLQEFIHTLDLHWVEHRCAYCNLDDVGRIQEKIKIEINENFSTILVERKSLDEYLNYGNFSLIRFVEGKRYFSSPLWNDGETTHLKSDDEMTNSRLNKFINEEDLSRSYSRIVLSNIIKKKYSID